MQRGDLSERETVGARVREGAGRLATAVAAERARVALDGSGRLLLRNELTERLAYELLGREDRRRDLRKRALGVPFAKPQVLQGLKRIRTSVCSARGDQTAVRRAIRMREVQHRGSRSRDEKPAFVDGEMVG